MSRIKYLQSLLGRVPGEDWRIQDEGTGPRYIYTARQTEVAKYGFILTGRAKARLTLAVELRNAAPQLLAVVLAAQKVIEEIEPFELTPYPIAAQDADAWPELLAAVEAITATGDSLSRLPDSGAGTWGEAHE